MKIDDNLLRKLAIRTISYFSDDLGMKNISDTFEIQSVNSIDYLDISTLISLSQDISGTIGMSVSNSLAKKMVENFIYGDITEEQIDELASESVSETLNVTLGNIIHNIEVVKNGGKVEISTPYTMHNKVSISKKQDGIMYLCILKYDNEEIILSYFI